MPFADAGSAVAGHVGGAARRVRRARTSSSSPDQSCRLARRDARRSSCSTTAASFRTTSSSASRSTARRTSCSRAGWPRTATSPSTRARSRRRFPNVYAVGDVATVGVPKAGVFSEGAARVVAASIVARRRGERAPDGYDGRGACYVEFGAGRVGRVDVDFLSGPKPTGTFQEPSRELVAEKQHFGASRRARWFGYGLAIACGRYDADKRDAASAGVGSRAVEALVPQPSERPNVLASPTHPALGHGRDRSAASRRRRALPAGRRDRRRRGDGLGRAGAPVGAALGARSTCSSPFLADGVVDIVTWGSSFSSLAAGPALVALRRRGRLDRGRQHVDPSRPRRPAGTHRRGLRRLRGGGAGTRRVDEAHARASADRRACERHGRCARPTSTAWATSTTPPTGLRSSTGSCGRDPDLRSDRSARGSTTAIRSISASDVELAEDAGDGRYGVAFRRR